MAHDNACLVEAMRPLFLGRLMEGGDPVEAEADLLQSRLDNQSHPYEIKTRGITKA